MSTEKYFFVFCKESVLLEERLDGSYAIPLSEEPPTEVKPWTVIMDVTTFEGHEVKAYYIDMPPASSRPLSLNPVPLRQSYYKLPLPFYLLAGKCAELLYWERSNRFCGVCGGRMKMHTNISKQCEQCGKEQWPQVAPAVIVLIHRGPDEVLLARGRSFRSNFYGLIAGFVETGETLEEAVHREVMEETGLRIQNLRYFGSQPWPYPSGVMVGYNADYLCGELHVQRDELRKAAWFRRDNLPNLPEKLSIARKLIDAWLEKG